MAKIQIKSTDLHRDTYTSPVKNPNPMQGIPMTGIPNNPMSGC